MSPVSPRILVVGCGAIGGVLSGYLLHRGHPLTVLSSNAQIARALGMYGLRLRAGLKRLRVPTPALLERLQGQGPSWDFILLAVQPPQLEGAVREVLPVLSPSGCVVCFQNGLCEERVAALVGAERVIGAVVTWGASMLEPGVYRRTSPGGFAIGRIDGTRDAKLEEVAAFLSAVGPVRVTDNLSGVRWSKLAFNCVVSTLGTIAGSRLGALLRRRFVRRLALEILTEVVHTARAERVRLEKLAGTLDLEWIALGEAEQLGTAAQGSVATPSLMAKHMALMAVGARYRNMRSSMLSAIERGRPPAVDFLNGEVVERAVRHGLEVPVNRAARDFVWSIARGERRPSLATVRELYDFTRERKPGTETREGMPDAREA